MAGAVCNEKSARNDWIFESTANLLTSCPMATEPGSYQVHTEARGPHWIGWVTRPGSEKPDRSVVLVAATQEEAEARARQWAEQTAY
jgi:hypothetical protein